MQVRKLDATPRNGIKPKLTLFPPAFLKNFYVYILTTKSNVIGSNDLYVF